MYKINETVLYSSTATVIIGTEPFPSPFTLGNILLYLYLKGGAKLVCLCHTYRQYTYRNSFIIYVYTLFPRDMTNINNNNKILYFDRPERHKHS